MMPVVTDPLGPLIRWLPRSSLDLGEKLHSEQELRFSVLIHLTFEGCGLWLTETVNGEISGGDVCYTSLKGKEKEDVF